MNYGAVGCRGDDPHEVEVVGFGRGVQRVPLNGRGRGREDRNDNNRWTHPYHKRCVLVLLLVIGSCSAEETMEVNGYNCGNITETEYVASDCSGNEHSMVMGMEDVVFVYRPTVSVLSGERCSATIHLEYFYCGAYSHVHILKAPTVEVVSFTPTECHNIVRTGVLVWSNQVYKVEMNSTTYVSLLLNGTLTYNHQPISGESNVQCQPLGLWVHNEMDRYGFAAGIMHVEIVSVPVLLDGVNLIDSVLNSQISTVDRCELGCQSGKFTYVLNHVNTEFRYMKSLMVQKYRINKVNLIKNMTLGVNFAVHEEYENMYRTEIPRLYLAMDKEWARNLPELKIEEMGIDLESVLHSTYETRNLENMVHSQFLRHSCVTWGVINRNYNVSYELGKKITKIGELLKIEFCEPVQIMVSLGEQLDCYRDMLTVKFKGQTMGLQADVRILRNISEVKRVICTESPTFLQLENGKFIGNKGTGLVIIQTTLNHNLHDNAELIDSNGLTRTVAMLAKVQQNLGIQEHRNYLDGLTGVDRVSEDDTMVHVFERLFTLQLSLYDMWRLCKFFLWCLCGFVLVIVPIVVCLCVLYYFCTCECVGVSLWKMKWFPWFPTKEGGVTGGRVDFEMEETVPLN